MSRRRSNCCVPAPSMKRSSWASSTARRQPILAGGCDLIEQMKLQWSRYEYLINLKTVPDLHGIDSNATHVEMGALTRLSEIERHVPAGRGVAALADAASRVATPQIRNMGTLGGNLLQDSRCSYYRGPWHCYRAGGIICDAHHGIKTAHALFGGHRCYTVSPSDTAPALVALDARVVFRGPDGEHEMPVADLFVLPDENIRAMHRLRTGEILSRVRVPVIKGRRSTFIKFAQRGAWDFAIASAAVAATIEDGSARDVRVVLGGVAPTPWRSISAESSVEGNRLTPELIEQASHAAVAGANPLDGNEYKIPLVRKLVREALTHIA